MKRVKMEGMETKEEVNLKTMSTHLCKNCGAALKMNEKKQTFFCSFCGKNYEASDFFENRALDQAMKSLKSGDYATAIYSFDQILAEDPSNPQILRGKFLASTEHATVKELTEDVSATIRKNDLDAIVKKSPERYRPFFAKFYDLASFNKEVQKKRTEIAEIQEDHDKQSKKLKKATNPNLKNICTNVGIILLWTFFFTEMIGFFASFGADYVLSKAGVDHSTDSTFKYAYIASFVASLTVSVIVRCLQVRKNIRKIQKDMAWSEARISHREAEVDALMSKREVVVKDIVKEDRVLYQDVRSGNIPESIEREMEDFDIECPTCSAGTMFFDATKMTYHCDSCGGFFEQKFVVRENLLKRANYSLKQREFFSASRNFRKLLEMEPGSFVAVRGAMLADGEITGVNELKYKTLSRFYSLRFQTYADRTTDDFRAYFQICEDLKEADAKFFEACEKEKASSEKKTSPRMRRETQARNRLNIERQRIFEKLLKEDRRIMQELSEK